MKMEVLSVQNQFGVIGSTKGKDWASPLTPPPPPPSLHHKHLQRNHPPSHLRNSSRSNDHTFGNSNADVVDGPTHARRAQQHPHTNATAIYSTVTNNQQQQKASVMEAAAAAAIEATNRASRSSPRYTYNNNLLYCGERAAAEAAAAAAAASPFINDGHFSGAADDDIDAGAIGELSQRLQAELRAAKSRHLACTEVSLPWDLTPRIAAEIIKSSEREPCGVRGCTVYIEFEDEPNNTRRIASFKVDPNTVSTFELYLTLKHDRSGWTSLLPQFLKNLTRSSTILISPDFSLTKNKLYSGE